MKNFKGKAIYKPKGKAAEYSEWVCGFYVGCSNNCTYCYLKKGRGAKILGDNTPTLKKCFKNKEHAFEIFKKELLQNREELKKHGLFLSFTTDPMLEKNIHLTTNAIFQCVKNGVPVKILTKQGNFMSEYVWGRLLEIAPPNFNKLIAFGFTLTGHDELEPNASTNSQRIEAMRKLHKSGFKTWASIEPVIDFESSYEMIIRTSEFCDLYKVGLESGRKYQQTACKLFIYNVCLEFPTCKFYFKDSLLKAAGIERKNLPDNCVLRDYKLV
jgi:DNA repair photolyase